MLGKTRKEANKYEEKKTKRRDDGEKSKAEDSDKDDKRPKHGDHMSSYSKNRKKKIHPRRKRERRVAEGDARNKHLRHNELEEEAKVDNVDNGAEKGSRRNGDDISQQTIHSERIKNDEAQDKRNMNVTSVDICNWNANEDKTRHGEKKGVCVEKRNDVLGAGALSLPVKVPVTSLHFKPNDKTTYLLGTASGEVLLVGNKSSSTLSNSVRQAISVTNYQ